MIPIALPRFLQITGAALVLTAALPMLAETPNVAASKDLFDGKSLAGWKATGFAGAGEVAVEDGKLVLSAGEPLTGVNGATEIPKTNYEVSMDAMRVEGSDFFCGLTFPVGDACVTLVVGGWGGSLVGISSINGEDASENETTQYKKFNSNQWYHVRVRVTPAKLEAWLDNEQIVNLPLEGKRLGMRLGEIEMSQPFGVASFRTRAAFRNIKFQPVTPAAK